LPLTGVRVIDGLQTPVIPHCMVRV
jgi:hypothetical protein